MAWITLLAHVLGVGSVLLIAAALIPLRDHLRRRLWRAKSSRPRRHACRALPFLPFLRDSEERLSKR
jgi:hypothetical protein